MEKLRQMHPRGRRFGPSFRMKHPSMVLGVCPMGGTPTLIQGLIPPPKKIGGTPAGYYRLQDGLPLTGGQRSAVPPEPLLAWALLILQEERENSRTPATNLFRFSPPG